MSHQDIETDINARIMGRLGETFVEPIESDEALAREMQQDLEALSRLADDQTVRIPEVNFVQVFLPYFAGDEVNLYDVSISNWITLVGGAYNKAYVVDRQGEVLFTVPPISDNSVFSSKGAREDYSNFLPEVVGTLNNYRARSDQQAGQFFRDFLRKYYESLIDKAFVADHILAWNHIFARYDRPLIEIPGLTDQGLNNTPTGNQISTTEAGEILDELDDL